MTLGGCDMTDSGHKLTPPTKDNAVTMASLPLIQNTLSVMAPAFGGSRNDIIMEQVCALAQGSKTQAQFDQFFASKNIALQKLAALDSGFAMLADNDLGKKQASCMAHIASSPSLSNIELTDNKEKLAQQLSYKMQVITTNAEFFSLIAEKIESTPATSIAQRKQEIIQQASALSPLYFVILAKNAPQNVHYDVVQLHNTFSLSGSDGYTLSLANNVVTLRLQNINWYGEGELLGKRYFTKVLLPSTE
ncbi:hypothetical protein ACQ86O_27615 (plasmid) [Serratia sp. L9]|uniref:hypothetical protein n=1 Tax=Serratia sp. L9 TaxID=3423946 RepID=UPI003D669917